MRRVRRPAAESVLLSLVLAVVITPMSANGPSTHIGQALTRPRPDALPTPRGHEEGKTPPVPTFGLPRSVSMASNDGGAEDKALVVTNSVRSSTARFALNRAAREAVQRLERPECRQVLSDFRDASGRTIQIRLDLLNETPRSYLTRLTFRDAFDHRCENSATLAFTYLESRDVFVCGTQFWQAYQRHPSYVEALVIHEMMHTLGLGENPPSSLEINARVLARCW